MSNINEPSTALLQYNCISGVFSYFSGAEWLAETAQGRPLWQFLAEDFSVRPECAQQLKEKILSANAMQAEYLDIFIHNVPYRVYIICTEPGGSVTITLTEASPKTHPCADDCDKLTHLMDRMSFCRRAEQLLAASRKAAYAVVYIDLLRFKVINDLFGRAKGDALLLFIAECLQQTLKTTGICCRIAADHFAVFLPAENGAPEKLLQSLQDSLSCYDLPFEITFHAGIYLTNDEDISANTMIDRASLAQSSIKGSYNIRFAYYNVDMRKALLGEQEITGMMGTALAEKQFIVHYQPQYNHSTGMLIGAEALVRWAHPDRYLIAPDVFIPIFEKNGFITNLDLYVFEEVCAFLRKCMDNHWALVPISVNFSRYDIFLADFVEQLEGIRRKYDIPTKYLRVELTESVMIGGFEYVNEIIGKLHACGYIIEMDDFGSGYSSLNVLKDIDLDMIKLDMRFLTPDSHSNKGGTILSSMVRMAKWLSLPVIAEGVETVEQADFLRSIGCDYIQGFLYAKPLPEAEYITLISSSRIGSAIPQMHLIETLNAFDFWDPASQETLIFSNYVGAAAIFDFHDGKVELLRVNKKYLQELGMNLSEKELIQSDPLATMDEPARNAYLQMLQRAIDTSEEQECETWWNISSSCCGDEHFCIRSTVRVIGISGDRYLFHAMIRNITAERLYYDSLKDSERRFKAASEQANIYYWEYTVATREMRPCFRCMRDLGLPALLTNYPAPAFEAGIFPPEVEEMYWDWHRQIAEGVPSLEAIIPLTADRIPFHVRYTTEFDENGHAVKAYGSATLVVE